MINAKYAKKYCKEDISKIENYEQAMNDKTQMWVCHHRTEIWWNCTRKDLIANECYYNRKALELIFLTKDEHNRIHNTGKTRSAETRKKMAEAAKGKTLSAETRKKMSDALKGRTCKPMSAETRKKLSDAKKGELNPMYGRTRHDETRKKIAESLKAAWAKRKLEGGK